jgi:hypothetical protein
LLDIVRICPIVRPLLGKPIVRRVHGEALFDLEQTDIDAAYRTSDDRAAAGLGAVGRASDDLAADDLLEVGCCFRSAWLALAPEVFWGGNSLKAHVDALDDDIVTALGGGDAPDKSHRSPYSGECGCRAPERAACVWTHLSPQS